MKFWEVTKALEEGKKVRKTYWKDNEYIYLDSNDNVRDNYNNIIGLYYIPNEDDWEIYE